MSFSSLLRLLALLPLLLCGDAWAQGSGGMFGDRNLGGGVSGRGTPGNQVEQAQSGAGEVSGDERFLRDNRNPGDFVGADSSDSSNFFGSEDGTNQINDLLGGGQSSDRDQGRDSNSARSREYPLRIRLQVDFAYQPSPQENIASRLQTRLARLETVEGIGPISVEINGRAAILRGAVATRREMVLAEQLARLEPGVSVVQNELVVAADRSLPAPQLPQTP